MRRRAPSFLSTWRKPLLAALVLLVGSYAIVYGAREISQELHRPLGPTLAIPSTTSTSTSTAAPVASASLMATTPAAVKAFQPDMTSLPPTKTPSPACGGPERMVILVVGADNKLGYTGGRADAIRVVRVDFIEESATVLAFPRDLWVSIPRLEEQGLYEGRINAAYYWGNVFLSPGEGPGLLAETLRQNFGLTVDHYFAINKRTFAKAIDALGGVDICLSEPIYRWTTDRPFLPQGCNRLSGVEALWLARIRVPYSDLQRIDHQTQFLLDLRENLLLPETWMELPSIISTFSQGVLTDLSKAEISSLLCLLAKMDPEDIAFYKIDRGMFAPVTTERGAQVKQPDESQIRQLVQDFLHGELK